MKLYAVVLSVAILFISPIFGQQTDSKTGVVLTSPTKPTTPSIDLTTVDFKNFTYPDPSGRVTEKTFTLTNGSSPQNMFSLRKAYFFELTRDDDDEAIVMINSRGCAAGCEERNLFYVFTADGNKPKLIFKLALGEAARGGLKAVNFSINEIAVEVFGDCQLNDWSVAADKAKSRALKPTTYTRLTFSRTPAGFVADAREVFPMAAIDLFEFRPKISFGSGQ